MRPEPNALLDKYRINSIKGRESPKGANWGIFIVGKLRVISSGSGDDGPNQEIDEWEHVSISLPNRTPTWAEMCFIKDLFWDKKETVVQFHPKESEYVNYHPFTLHLWKRRGEEYKLPPRDTMV